MESSEPSIISLDTYDRQNRRSDECPSLQEIILIINKMLSECREDFFSLYPKRPVDDSEVARKTSCEVQGIEVGTTDLDSDLEYADTVIDPIELGTSLFYEEDLVRRFVFGGNCNHPAGWHAQDGGPRCARLGREPRPDQKRLFLRQTCDRMGHQQNEAALSNLPVQGSYRVRGRFGGTVQKPVCALWPRDPPPRRRL